MLCRKAGGASSPGAGVSPPPLGGIPGGTGKSRSTCRQTAKFLGQLLLWVTMDVTKKPQMHFKALKCHLEAKVKHVRRRSRHRLLLKPARLHPLGPQRMRGRAGAHAHRSSGAGPTSPHSWQLQSPLTHHLLSSYLGKVLIYTIDATKVPQSRFLGRSHT